MIDLPSSLIPADDSSRLRTLHHYQILNTTPERIFDEYVALAAQLFNLPISLISLVDKEQVFYKANTGLPELGEVARPDSLCSAAILQNQVLTYTDLAKEGCALVNPFVAQSAGLRFYAGAALHMPNGAHIGSLCVIGRDPRPIAPEEEKLLTALADLVSLTIELRHAYLSRGRATDWQAKQLELEELLHDNAAVARYLTNRTGTISANGQELDGTWQRLEVLRGVLTGHLVEFNDSLGS